MTRKSMGALLFWISITVMSFAVNATPKNVSIAAKQYANTPLNLEEIIAHNKQERASYIHFLKTNERNKAKNTRNIQLRLMKASFEPKKPTSRNNNKYNKSLKVIATAYTSHVAQTDSTPNIAAWGDRLKPGMKVIAVSRDLLNVFGLKHRQKVRIKGLEGEYLVLDKMNKRWRKKIDIYMGKDKKKAFQWGRRKVEIQWNS